MKILPKPAPTGWAKALGYTVIVCVSMILLVGCPDEPGGTPTPVNNDVDDDGVLNADDVDDDNDGLIEISSLEQLHNMRYDLTGNSYKMNAADAGNTAGAPTTATADCTTPTDGIYLCGYELTQNLDFDLDGDGSTYTANQDGTYTLDSGDAAPYFVTSAGGWEPIGDSADVSNAFDAVFDGNGFTIANMTISHDAATIGLFGTIGTGTGSVIRDVGLTDVLVENTSSDTFNFIGGITGLHNPGALITASYVTGIVDGGPGGDQSIGCLVGSLFGSITASSADCSVTGGSGNNNAVGGLAGQHSGNITSSYAAGSVNSGDGERVRIGGLVGQIASGGTITASYASGNVNGSSGDGDQVGGLVGSVDGVITASYASGNVDGGSGDGDQVGGLAGRADAIITASYATGNVDGGTSTDTGDYAGSLFGIQPAGYIIASYGFGTTANGPAGGVSTMPSGVTAATALTVANTGGVGCDNSAYTTQAACTATSKAAGVWSVPDCSPPGSGATDGVDYTRFNSMAACTATMKEASNWLTVSWNDAGDNTQNAWVFATGKAPRLRYADYDGTGTEFDCSMFPASVNCGSDEIPGQPGQ